MKILRTVFLVVVTSLCLLNSQSALAVCPAADLDGDCYVAVPDLIIFVGQWLDWGDPNACTLSADLFGVDCEVLNDDFSVLSSLWHQCSNTYDPDCVWASQTQCHGDGDSGGSLGPGDLNILEAAILSSYPDAAYDPRADFSRDGGVGVMDLFEFLYWMDHGTLPSDCPPGRTPPRWPGCWLEPTQCYGDVNWSGTVNTADQTWLVDSWGLSYPHLSYNPCADFNRDGTVNTDDLNIMILYFEKDLSLYPPCSEGGTWPPL